MTRVVSIDRVAFGLLPARTGLQDIELALISRGHRNDFVIAHPLARAPIRRTGERLLGTQQLHNLGLDDGVGGKIMGFSFAAKLRP